MFSQACAESSDSQTSQTDSSPNDPIAIEKQVSVGTAETNPEPTTEENAEARAKLDLVDQRILEISGLIENLESEEASHEQQESIEYLEDELAMAQEEKEDIVSQYGLY